MRRTEPLCKVTCSFCGRATLTRYLANLWLTRFYDDHRITQVMRHGGTCSNVVESMDPDLIPLCQSLVTQTLHPFGASVARRKKKGYVPSNCVISENALDRYEWCHGAINRSAAEFLLVKNGTTGAYLVRESQSKPGEYTLSLFDSQVPLFRSDLRWTPELTAMLLQVAHYRINQNPDGSCFIRAKQIFTSIPELIEHHKGRTSGLPVLLTYCIPKAGKRAVVISKKLEEAWELNRKDVKMGKMLGAGNYGEVYKVQLLLNCPQCGRLLTTPRCSLLFRLNTPTARTSLLSQ